MAFWPSCRALYVYCLQMNGMDHESEPSLGQFNPSSDCRHSVWPGLASHHTTKTDPFIRSWLFRFCAGFFYLYR